MKINVLSTLFFIFFYFHLLEKYSFSRILLGILLVSKRIGGIFK